MTEFRNNLESIEARYGDPHQNRMSLRHRFLYRKDCQWSRACSIVTRNRNREHDWLQRRKRQWFLRHLSHVIDRMEGSLTLEQRFREQADKWQKETQHLSSPSQRMMHPSYQAILGMGNENPREIVSLMIRDMQEHRRPWFWALSYFAQDNPVSQSEAGNTDKMIKAWVNWEKVQRLP